jgi:hypothetical protein
VTGAETARAVKLSGPQERAVLTSADDGTLVGVEQSTARRLVRLDLAELILGEGVENRQARPDAWVGTRLNDDGLRLRAVLRAAGRTGTTITWRPRPTGGYTGDGTDHTYTVTRGPRQWLLQISAADGGRVHAAAHTTRDVCFAVAVEFEALPAPAGTDPADRHARAVQQSRLTRQKGL